MFLDFLKNITYTVLLRSHYTLKVASLVTISLITVTGHYRLNKSFNTIIRINNFVVNGHLESPNIKES